MDAPSQLRALALLIGSTLACKHSTTAEGVRLVERWSVRIPNGNPVLGAFPRNRDEIIVWSRTGTLTAYKRDTVEWQVTLPDSSELVHVLPGLTTNSILAVDAKGQRLFDFDSTGHSQGVTVLSLGSDERIIDVAIVGSQLLVGTFDSLNAAYRLRSHSGGELHEVWGMRAARSTAADPPFRLSVVAGRAILAETEFPYGLLVLGEQSRVRTLTMGGLLIASTAPDQAQAWRALQVVDLGRGALQTHTMLSGDQRRLIRYTNDWNRAAITEFDAPFAVLSSDISSQTLVGARSAGGLEIAVYSWEWRS